MSLGGMILGPLVEIMHLQDWWSPVYVCQNCNIHIEDLVFGFSTAGIAAVFYNALFVRKQTRPKFSIKKVLFLLIIVIEMQILSFMPLFLPYVSSFFSVCCAGIITALILLFQRPDLIKTVLFSGVGMLVLSIPAYKLGLLIDPNWTITEWRIAQLTGWYISEIPIEDLIWFFIVGIVFSGVWKFVAEIYFKD